jgi:hypothetical protein
MSSNSLSLWIAHEIPSYTQNFTFTGELLVIVLLGSGVHRLRTCNQCPLVPQEWHHQVVPAVRPDCGLVRGILQYFFQVPTENLSQLSLAVSQAFWRNYCKYMLLQTHSFNSAQHETCRLQPVEVGNLLGLGFYCFGEVEASRRCNQGTWRSLICSDLADPCSDINFCISQRLILE